MNSRLFVGTFCLLVGCGFAGELSEITLFAASCDSLNANSCSKSELCGDPQECKNGETGSSKVVENFAVQVCKDAKKGSGLECKIDTDDANKVPCYRIQLYGALNCPDGSKAGDPSTIKKRTVCAGSTACGTGI